MNYLRARQKVEKDQRRKAKIEASKHLFSALDVDKTSIDQIAKACGLSRALIYTYFLDKRHIFLAIVSEALEELLQEFRSVAAANVNGLDKISAIG